MAKKIVTKEIIICNRCAFGTETEAVEERVFALDDRHYLLDLCAKHAAMFDRDFGAWTRLAEEIDKPTDNGRQHSNYFTAARKDETERLRQLAERAEQKAREKLAEAQRQDFERRRSAQLQNEAEEQRRQAREEYLELQARQSIPGAQEWQVTRHARARMVTRHVNIHEVLSCAAQPDRTVPQPWRGDHIQVFTKGRVRLAVDVAKKLVITVIDRNAPPETEESYRLQTQQAAKDHESTPERTAL